LGSFSSIFGGYLYNLINKEVAYSSPKRFTVIGFIAVILLVFFSMKSCVSESAQENVDSNTTTEKIIGQEKNGTKSQSFEKAYIGNGGLNKLGEPTNFLQRNTNLQGISCSPSNKNGCFSKIQAFSGGSEQKGAIIQSSNDSNAYWVGGSFWETFKEINEKYGKVEPVSDQQQPVRIRYVQKGKEAEGSKEVVFSKQMITQNGGKPGCAAIIGNGSKVYYVIGPIGCYYLQAGGEKTWLGLPTTNPQDHGLEVIQYFMDGCLKLYNWSGKVEPFPSSDACQR
jgi:hypothetical protein